jgi:hypothetical protein
MCGCTGDTISGSERTSRLLVDNTGGVVAENALVKLSMPLASPARIMPRRKKTHDREDAAAGALADGGTVSLEVGGAGRNGGGCWTVQISQDSRVPTGWIGDVMRSEFLVCAGKMEGIKGENVRFPQSRSATPRTSVAQHCEVPYRPEQGM